jgi:UDP-glucose 4-epimerase
MKVCVVGGSGYIGSHAVYELIRDGHEVTVIDNLSTGFEDLVHKDAKFYNGDITKKKELLDIFESEKGIDVVMHFAAKLIVPESVEQPLEYYYNNVEGVRTLLEVMTEVGIKNIIFSSTAAVYGEPENSVCREGDVTEPVNPYGDTKLACEKLIKWVSQAYDMNYCIFRYFNVAGADESLEIGYKKSVVTHLIPIVAGVALGKREALTVYGDDYDTPDGTCVRDYIHVSDLARAHVMGAKYIFENNKSLLCNLGSSTGYSVMEVIKAVEKFKPVNYKMGERRDGDPAKLVAATDKAKEILGWEPEYDLNGIIDSDMKFMMKEGE